MNFKPTANLIVLEYVDKPYGEIVLPESLELSYFQVVALGCGFLTQNGWAPIPLSVGDKVQLKNSAKNSAQALPPHMCDGRKLLLVEFEHVAGVWEGDLPSPATVRKVARAAAVPQLPAGNNDKVVLHG